MTRSKSRREVLLGAAALAGTACLPRTASAQAKGRIVVGTWGGDYARLLNKNIEVPILIKDGWEVVQDQAGDPERRSKMLAEQRLPRGTSDVQGLSALNMFQMHDAGIVLPIDYGKLKNAGNLLPSMKYPYGVGHIYSGKVGVYNPKLFTTAPVSYKDVFDPEARQQARHHRHPVPVHAGLRDARRRRQGQRSRARQEAAAGMQERRHADLSDQRGVRARA